MQKLLMLLPALLVACANPTVMIDNDPAVDFSQYKTYYWAQKPEGAAPLMTQRIEQGIDDRLQAKGWKLDPDNGGVALAAHVATDQKKTIDTFYTGMPMGGWGWYGWRGLGSSTSMVRTYDVGTLVVDMFDSDSKKAIWRGSASNILSDSPDKMKEILATGLDKMFEAFPPSAPALTP